MDGYEYTDRKPIAPCSGEEVGNPCDVASGAKIIRELDYAGPGLELTRTFNSQSEGDWNHNFSQYFIPEGNWANGLMTAAGYVTVVRRRSLSYS
jgi:hypothetical protein